MRKRALLRCLLVMIPALSIMALTYAQDENALSLKERAMISKDGRYVTVAPPSTTPTYTDLDQITALSSHIMVGTVMGNRCKLSADGNSITTEYEMQRHEVIKGGLYTNPIYTFTVSVPGGRVEFLFNEDININKVPPLRARTVYAEVRTPWFKKLERGKQYYLFLTGASSSTFVPPPDLAFIPVGGPQGVFEVAGGVVKSNSGRAGDPIWQYHNLPVSSFVNMLRGSLTRDLSCSTPGVSCMR